MDHLLFEVSEMGGASICSTKSGHAVTQAESVELGIWGCGKPPLFKSTFDVSCFLLSFTHIFESKLSTNGKLS